MDKELLIKEINKWQEILVQLAMGKQNTLQDPEVYRCSCKVDQLIVEYMKCTQ